MERKERCDLCGKENIIWEYNEISVYDYQRAQEIKLRQFERLKFGIKIEIGKSRFFVCFECSNSQENLLEKLEELTKKK